MSSEHHYTPHWYDTRVGHQRLRPHCTCGWKGRTWTDSTRTGLAFTRAYDEWVSHWFKAMDAGKEEKK